MQQEFIEQICEEIKASIDELYSDAVIGDNAAKKDKLTLWCTTHLDEEVVNELIKERWFMHYYDRKFYIVGMLKNGCIQVIGVKYSVIDKLEHYTDRIFKEALYENARLH